MPTRPRLLDLFCGAGGAATGYHRAGFEVVGVDIKPQPHYPFEFHLGDAREAVAFPLLVRRSYAAVHASPPCQAFTSARVIHGNHHEDLLTPSRRWLESLGLPYVIENVPGAPMRRDFVLCGSQFGESRLVRHRWFEVNWPVHLELLPRCAHAEETISVFGHGGHVYHGVDNWREVMGIDWMTRDELSQAIPPTYTEYVGKQLMAHLREPSHAH
jgi:DNA (cytosine-5)-methyltransferase 1